MTPEQRAAKLIEDRDEWDIADVVWRDGQGQAGTEYEVDEEKLAEMVAAAIRDAVAVERERAVAIAESWDGGIAEQIAIEIRGGAACKY